MEKEAEYYTPTWKLLLAVEFWKLYFICALQIFYGYFMIISYKNYGMWTINDDNFLMASGAIGLLLNGIFRWVWPNLMDAFSFKCVNICVLLLQINLIIALPFLTNMPNAYFFAVMFSIMCEGAIASLIPTLSLKIFGERKGPTVYSFLYSSIGISALLGSVLVDYFLYEIQYNGILLIALVFSICAFVLTVCLNERKFDFRRIYNNLTDAPEEVKDSSSDD